MPGWLRRMRTALKGSSKSEPVVSKGKTVSPPPLLTAIPLEKMQSAVHSNGVKPFKVIEPTKQVATEDEIRPCLKQFQGAVVVVIGANAGIGFALCKTLTKYGFTVIGCAKSEELLKVLSEECKERNYKGQLFSYKTELHDEKDIHNLFNWVHEKFRRVDIVINNPDLVNDKAFKRVPDENLIPTIQKRMKILAFSMAVAADYMSQNKGLGYIFNMCCASEKVLTAYAHIHESLAAGKLPKKGNNPGKIKVFGISPGKQELDLYKRAYGDKFCQLTLQQTPTTDQLFYPQEIANSLLYALAKVSCSGR